MNAAHLEFCGGPVWQQMVEEMVMPTVMEGIDLGDDAVEIGPGPGFTTDVLRTQVARLTAVEIDPDLAEKLKDRLAGTNVDVLTGDASALDLPDDRFTGAVSLNMLHHVPTDELQDRIFAELHRVLRPSGRLIVSDAQPRDDLDAFHEGDTYHPIAPGDLESRLGAAGFRDLEIGDYDLGWICSARAV
jgi:SAM-dependent methyltransferase